MTCRLWLIRSHCRDHSDLSPVEKLIENVTQLCANVTLPVTTILLHLGVREQQYHKLFDLFSMNINLKDSRLW